MLVGSENTQTGPGWGYSVMFGEKLISDEA
jgi:hypothetical protein